MNVNFSRPRISPDGKYAVSMVRWQTNTFAALIDLSTGDTVHIETSDSLVFTQPVWAPSGHVLYARGRMLVGGTMQRGIIKYDVDAKNAEVIWRAPAAAYPLLAAAPDGKSVAFVTISSVPPDSMHVRLDTVTLHVVDIATQTERTVARVPIARATIGGGIWRGGLTFTPDGKRLLFTRTDGTEPNWRSEVMSVDVQTGAIESTGLTGIAIRDLSFAPDGRLTYTVGPFQKLEVWAVEDWENQIR